MSAQKLDLSDEIRFRNIQYVSSMLYSILLLLIMNSLANASLIAKRSKTSHFCNCNQNNIYSID